MDTDTEVRPPQRLFTVAEYHRMGEAGVFDEDERLELVDGKVVPMSPIGPRHQLVVEALYDILSEVVDRQRVLVRQQGPVMLDHRSERHPDIALIRKPWRGYPGAHPGVQDILLLVEVSDSTARADRGAKLGLYAQVAVPEVWIIDLNIDRVRVYRDPNPARRRFTTSFDVAPDGHLTVQAISSVTIPAEPLFRPPPVLDAPSGNSN